MKISNLVLFFFILIFSVWGASSSASAALIEGAVNAGGAVASAVSALLTPGGAKRHVKLRRNASAASTGTPRSTGRSVTVRDRSGEVVRSSRRSTASEAQGGEAFAKLKARRARRAKKAEAREVPPGLDQYNEATRAKVIAARKQAAAAREVPTGVIDLNSAATRRVIERAIRIKREHVARKRGRSTGRSVSTSSDSTLSSPRSVKSAGSSSWATSVDDPPVAVITAGRAPATVRRPVAKKPTGTGIATERTSHGNRTIYKLEGNRYIVGSAGKRGNAALWAKVDLDRNTVQFDRNLTYLTSQKGNSVVAEPVNFYGAQGMIGQHFQPKSYLNPVHRGGTDPDKLSADDFKKLRRALGFDDLEKVKSR